MTSPVTRRTLATALALALAGLPATPAFAQPRRPAPAAPAAPPAASAAAPGTSPSTGPTAAADARLAFDSAQKLFDEGRLEEAHELFGAAYRASGSPNARLMAARCLTALGRFTEAYDEMAATSREATARAEQDPHYVPTRDAAATELALLERRVGKVTVVVADFVVGTAVKLNGVPLGTDRLGSAVAVAPGKVTVEVRAPGAEPVVRESSIGAAEAQTITIALATRPEAPVVIVAPPPPPPPARISPVRSAGIAVASFGVIGMAVFAGAGVAANGKYADLKRACGTMRCTDPAFGSTVDAGRTFDTTANVALTAGLVGLVGGGLMIAFGGPRKAADAPVAATARGLSVAF